MQPSKNRLAHFRNQNRRTQIQSIMARMRYQNAVQYQLQALDILIKTPLEELTSQHLQQLISYANQDHTNALLHLGNLIIDRVITPQQLQNASTWHIGNNQSSTWLINVFAEVGYLTQEMMDHLQDRIANKKTQRSLENAIEAVQRCLKYDLQFTINWIGGSERIMYGLIHHIQDPGQKVFLLVLELLVEASGSSETFPRRVVEVVGFGRIQKSLLHASMKLSAHGRCLTIQIANNFMLSGIFFESFTSRILQNSHSQKDSVKVELSYYYIALAKVVKEEYLRFLVQQLSFMYILNKFMQIKEISRHANEIHQNAREAIQIIGQRLYKPLNQGYQICRGTESVMRDQSQEITGIHMQQQYLE